ncbi:MAG: DUF1648 domain-containing protein [Saprospiraceae bacterium]|jgi:uncharacterized membrane protein
MPEPRPRLRPHLTVSDWFVEFVGWGLLIGLWGYTLGRYGALPEHIPTHFNAAGEADAFGGKQSLLALPVVATVLFVGLSILNRFPHLFNYLQPITQENALQQYTIATRMIRVLKLVLAGVFFALLHRTVQTAQGDAQGLGTWFLPLVLALVYLPLGYYLYKSFR